MPTTNILLDTNFLLIPAQFKVDIFSEIDRIADFRYKVIVLDKTIDELKKIIKEQKGKNKRAASLALQLLKTKHIKTLNTQKLYKPVDEIILNLAKKSFSIVATQDKALKTRLKAKGVKLIVLRQKKYLKIL